MKKLIGEKSKGEIITNGIVFILVLIVLALPIIAVAIGSRNFEASDLITFYIFLSFVLVINIVILVNMIRISKLPKELIFVDDETLYIYEQNVYKEIPLDEIIQATPKIATSGRGIHYTFGEVVIHTKDHHYSIKHVASVEAVCLSIMKRVKHHDENLKS